MTAALLDRLTHRAEILEFLGESFRFRQRMQREAQQQVSSRWALDSDALWMACTYPQGLDLHPLCLQPQLRGGPLFVYKVVPFSIIKVHTTWSKWFPFRL